ncbi:MAG: cyclase family protein [Bacteroidia bacterium]
MLIEIFLNEIKYCVDLSKPLDISIPLRAGEHNVNAWYVKPVEITPVEIGNWIGDVNKGGSVNFRNIFFNPHGNGTHTECVGHISKENYTINQCLNKYFFYAKLITVLPHEIDGDKIITLAQIEAALREEIPEALIIRTLPNTVEKINRQYSNTNPPYIESKAAEWMHQKNINHLLIDLPSVDKEHDDGKLLAHHAFWQYPHNTQKQRTITELIYVPNSIADGNYLLNIQIASFENDASPSKPVLYALNSF